GSDSTAQMAQATGLTQSEIEQHLAAVLPQLIDRPTPGGQIPSGDLRTTLSEGGQWLPPRRPRPAGGARVPRVARAKSGGAPPVDPRSADGRARPDINNKQCRATGPAADQALGVNEEHHPSAFTSAPLKI